MTISYFLTRLTIGATASETPIPMVPASGDPNPATDKPIHTPSPRIIDEKAASFVVFFQNRPQMNGPRNADPMAPHDMARIVTMVEGLIRARITDNSTKNRLL